MKLIGYNEKTKTQSNQIMSILKKNAYVKAKQLAKLANIPQYRVYLLVRIMRENGVPIMPTKQGYILAHAATLADDVYFIRRLNGRRVSDQVMLDSVHTHIENRWRKAKPDDQKAIKRVMSPILGGKNIFKSNQKLLDGYMKQL